MGAIIRVTDERQANEARLQAASDPLKLAVINLEGTNETIVTTAVSKTIAKVAVEEGGSKPYYGALDSALDGALLRVGIAPSGTPPSGSLWQYWQGQVERRDRAPRTVAPQDQQMEQHDD